MNAVAEISKHITRLGTRTYRHRLDASTPSDYRVARLARLNHDLDCFYELLYEQFDSVTPVDYAHFGSKLQLMLSTISELYQTCLKLPSTDGLVKEAERLYRNYSAIYELDSDLRNFRFGSVNQCVKSDTRSKISAALSKM